MKFSLALILVAAPAVWAADLTPMNVKTGQWETTMTMQMSGMPMQAHQMPAIPPEALAKMPPEQRAKMEAMMSGMGGGAPKPIVEKSCIKKEDLTKMPMADRDKSCKSNVISTSLMKQVIEVACDHNGVKTVSTMTVEATSSDAIKFNMVSKSTGGEQNVNMSMNMSGTSKYLGPVCAETK